MTKDVIGGLRVKVPVTNIEDIKFCNIFLPFPGKYGSKLKMYLLEMIHMKWNGKP